MYDLTDEEKRDLINREVTIAYPKMVKDFYRITSYGSKQYEDLLPFCISEFLTKKTLDYQFKVAVIDKKLLNYMGRSMSLNLKSSSSPYWTNYRRESYNSRGAYLAETNRSYIQGEFDEIRDLDGMDEFECMLYQLEKLNFYHKALVTDYFLNKMTLVQMNKKYGITLSSLKKGIDEGLEIIKTECKKIL